MKKISIILVTLIHLALSGPSFGDSIIPLLAMHPDAAIAALHHYYRDKKPDFYALGPLHLVIDPDSETMIEPYILSGVAPDRGSNYPDALAYCESIGGELPTIDQLQALRRANSTDPVLDPTLEDLCLWSGSSDSKHYDSTLAIMIQLGRDGEWKEPKYYRHPFVCVSSIQLENIEPFVIQIAEEHSATRRYSEASESFRIAAELISEGPTRLENLRKADFYSTLSKYTAEAMENAAKSRGFNTVFETHSAAIAGTNTAAKLDELLASISLTESQAVSAIESTVTSVEAALIAAQEAKESLEVLAVIREWLAQAIAAVEQVRADAAAAREAAEVARVAAPEEI